MARSPLRTRLSASVTLTVGLVCSACAWGGQSSTPASASVRSAPALTRADRAFAACLKRAGARNVSSRADLRFLRGSSTEADGGSATTNGLVSAGRGVITIEWMTVSESRWRVFSRSHERQTDSPDYEGIWQRVLRDSPDLAVLAVKRTGSPASFRAARRCIT